MQLTTIRESIFILISLLVINIFIRDSVGRQTIANIIDYMFFVLFRTR